MLLEIKILLMERATLLKAIAIWLKERAIVSKDKEILYQEKEILLRVDHLMKKAQRDGVLNLNLIISVILQVTTNLMTGIDQIKLFNLIFL